MLVFFFDLETSRPVSKCSCRGLIRNSPKRGKGGRVAHARIQDQLDFATQCSLLKLLTRRIKIQGCCSMSWKELLNIRDHLSSQICGDELHVMMMMMMRRASSQTPGSQSGSLTCKNTKLQLFVATPFRKHTESVSNSLSSVS